MKKQNANKLTPKQETFAMSYVETGNASEAYRRAYDVGPKTKMETINRKAKELIDNGKISARVVELRQVLSDRHDITLDNLTNEYFFNLEMAREALQIGAANQAIANIAKLHGLDTKKISVSNEVTQKTEVSDLEVARRLAFLLRKGVHELES